MKRDKVGNKNNSVSDIEKLEKMHVFEQSIISKAFILKIKKRCVF